MTTMRMGVECLHAAPPEFGRAMREIVWLWIPRVE